MMWGQSESAVVAATESHTHTHVQTLQEKENSGDLRCRECVNANVLVVIYYSFAQHYHRETGQNAQ